MRLNVEQIALESRFWNQVNILAKEAFPPEEYLAPSELVKMAQSDNFDFLALLDMVLHTFQTGKVRIDQAIPLHEANPFAVTGLFRSKKKQMMLPVSVI